LSKLPDEALTGERRTAHEGTKRCLGALPQFEDVGGAVFAFARLVEPCGDGFDAAKRRHRRLLVPVHLTIRRSPASALPRMKL
jgi:hypothetical protein